MDFQTQATSRPAPFKTSMDVEERAFVTMLRAALRDPDLKSDATLPPSVKSGPTLLAQASASGAASSVAAGEDWPRGTGVEGLSNAFWEATPPELRDLAPEGMSLPVGSGFNLREPTEASATAAGRIGAMTLEGLFSLERSLMNHYVEGDGSPRELETRHVNDVLEHAAKAKVGFMSDQVEQIESAIREQIERTGQTSGTIRGVTDWDTTVNMDFKNSLGVFSAKLMYELTFEQTSDGRIVANGHTALALQDLYDFSTESLSTPIPAFTMPAAFRDREGYTSVGGNLTDRALGHGLQQEGHATPFYIYGASDLASVTLDLPEHLRDNSWKISL